MEQQACLDYRGIQLDTHIPTGLITWNQTRGIRHLDLVEKIVELHSCLTKADIPHAFGEEVPFLSCVDLDFVAGVTSHYLGADDHRLKRLLSLYQTE